MGLISKALNVNDTQYIYFTPLMQGQLSVVLNFAVTMLTEEEKRFIQYWEQNRLRRKKIWRQLAVGLPFGVLLAIAICINFFSGWYKRADLMLHADPSLILVLLVAILLIVLFIVVFSARHKWDMNEQHYRELLSRKEIF
jgi:peptidoglycan/LPS O-acetylase OafA/YrhL